jgi:rod shape determining protein RodA
LRKEEFSFRRIDPMLLGLYLLMVSIGIVNIYSSNFNPDRPKIYDLNQEYGKQIMWFGFSLLLGGVILLLEGSFIRKFSYEFYGVVCLLLVAVLIVGEEKNGAKAWFGIGNFGVQPSEFAKIAVSLALAKFLSTMNIKLEDFKTKIYTAFFILFPAFLILLQPDAGTVVVFTCFILVLYREGMSGNLLLFGLFELVIAILTLMLKDSTMDFPFLGEQIPSQIGLGVIIFIIAILVYFIVRQVVNKRNRKVIVVLLLLATLVTEGCIFGVKYGFDHLKKHQKDRIESTLGLIDDPDGLDYNQDRSKAAIGSGGFAGKGFMKSTLANAGQKHVPMQTTDFIFCTLSEEWGFLGSGLVILLFTMLFFRIIFIAERQRSPFTRLFAYCIVNILFFHFLINIGMATGLAPVIGIPLPFFSYGGSSLMSFSVLIFILLRLDAERLDVLR